MSTVVLINKTTNEVVKRVTTEDIPTTIDALMRNRDPAQYLARKG